jgi:hypothetical protein
MRRLSAVTGWLPVVLRSACTASHTVKCTAEQMTVRPAVDRLLTGGQLQRAEAQVHDFGCDPGPVDGVYTAEMEVAVRACQIHYGLSVSGLLDRATCEERKLGVDRKRGDESSVVARRFLPS